jgi:hypothetical protein
MSDDDYPTYPGLVHWPVVMLDGTTSVLVLPEDKAPPPGFGFKLLPIPGRPGVVEIQLVPVTP